MSVVATEKAISYYAVRHVGLYNKITVTGKNIFCIIPNGGKPTNDAQEFCVLLIF